MKFLSFPVIETPDKYGIAPNDMLDPIESKLIITACLNRAPANVLEIGTCRGKTTANMAKVLLPTGGELVSVDVISKPDSLPTEQNGEVPGKECQAGEEIPAEYRDFVKLELIDPNDDDALNQICIKYGPFDVIFIDGDHSYSGVSHDRNVVKRHVKRDGVILLHDIWWDVFPPPVDGPLKLLQELNGTILNLSHTGAFWHDNGEQRYSI